MSSAFTKPANGSPIALRTNTRVDVLRAKPLKLEWSRVFVRIHSEVQTTDARFASHVNARREVVTRWRNPDAPDLPNLAHLSGMPDDVLDRVMQALAELRYANGFELRRWVAIACDERAPSADTRLEAVKLMASELLRRSQELLALAAVIAKERGR